MNNQRKVLFITAAIGLLSLMFLPLWRHDATGNYYLFQLLGYSAAHVPAVLASMVGFIAVIILSVCGERMFGVSDGQQKAIIVLGLVGITLIAVNINLFMTDLRSGDWILMRHIITGELAYLPDFSGGSVRSGIVMSMGTWAALIALLFVKPLDNIKIPREKYWH
ncbi:MAG: hypothetical protein FWC95_00225 [Defluviitaleaceae bacterium]|nr:hypothetical protein [Defluviitaleaceae bacterium]